MDDADMAEQLAQEERERGIAAAKAVVAGEGADDCTNCGDPIVEARRRAMPSARRCHACQQIAERVKRLFGSRQ